MPLPAASFSTFLPSSLSNNLFLTDSAHQGKNGSYVAGWYIGFKSVDNFAILQFRSDKWPIVQIFPNSYYLKKKKKFWEIFFFPLDFFSNVWWLHKRPQQGDEWKSWDKWISSADIFEIYPLLSSIRLSSSSHSWDFNTMENGLL